MRERRESMECELEEEKAENKGGECLSGSSREITCRKSNDRALDFLTECEDCRRAPSAACVVELQKDGLLCLKQHCAVFLLWCQILDTR